MQTNNSTINESKKNVIPKKNHFNIVWQILVIEVGNVISKNKKVFVLIIIILLLLFSNIFFGFKYFTQLKETKKIQKELGVNRTNDKIVSFFNIFIQEVLKTDEEISFEDRLKLENAVRDINDQEILSAWEEFTNGQDEFEIQQGVKDLIEILVSKIVY